ncbi:MAG: DUF2917 domain-containing protein [Burkholderiales bacterium]|nr:DUF2917 domain-containing protein [Burkholderiales bacterium]
MQFDASQALVPLASQQPLRLIGARGTHLRAVTGQLWVTMDHDPRDLVLQPGQSLVVDTSRPVMVSALGGKATVGVCAPQRPAAAWQAWLARLAGAAVASAGRPPQVALA